MAFFSSRRLIRPDRGLFPGIFPRPRLVEACIPGGPEGLRILFVSDVHLRPGVSQARLEALMDQMAAAEADLLMLGGDYAETPQDCQRFFSALRRVHFPLGGYAVLGNNDFQSRETLAETARTAGVTLLVNEAVTLTLPDGPVQIGGCDELKYGIPQTQSLFSEGSAYRILLSHYPVRPDCSCDLMLCGHTHAGQCNLWGITPYLLGFEHKYRLLALKGAHQMQQMHLLVSNGIGISRVPLRLGAEPQIYLLKFSR